ncbi:MAG: nucleoside hydrolase [Caldilineaceae bacterium]
MQHVIFDTDIGSDVDDAMALALLAASPAVHVVGVTTVHADAPLRARIARKVLALAGRTDIPVIPGASLPLHLPLPEKFHWNPHLRGHEGKGILNDEERRATADLYATADDAARFLIATAAAYKGELCVVAVGSLTNLGRALQIEPRLAHWLRAVTIMGGVVDTQRFTWPPLLETNLNCDPLATELVFSSGVPITLVPMEVTTQVYLTPEMRAAMRAWARPLSDVLVDLMEEMLASFATLSDELGLPADFYAGRTFMHDPLAVYASMAQELVAVRREHVQIEVIDRVVRTISYVDRAPNMAVCYDIDAPGFVSYWLERVKALVSSSSAWTE